MKAVGPGGRARSVVDEPVDLGLLFHRLNNQLGIILANAELLEAKAVDGTVRARASQVAASAVEAMATAHEIRLRTRDDDVS
jgi:two-component sensor histidine kinase